MLRKLKDQPLAFVAIFLLISGSAFALGGAPRPGGPSPGPTNPAVTGQDIKNGTITIKDFAPGVADALKGAPGKKGGSGAPGPTGLAGPKGAAGPPGTAGAEGADGANGVNGGNGADGAPGPIGPRGLLGPTGPTGAQGQQGEQGIQGPAGSGVADGPSVMMGRIEPAGAAECLVGSPVGFTDAAGCNDIGRDMRKMQVPVSKTLRNFAASVDSVLAFDALVSIVSRGANNSTSTVASCTIPATGTGCLIQGPVTVSAGTRLVIEVNFDPASNAAATTQGVMFGYELFKP